LLDVPMAVIILGTAVPTRFSRWLPVASFWIFTMLVAALA
jgi:hypothetical protein